MTDIFHRSIILVGLLCLAADSPCSAATYYVRKTGSDTNSGTDRNQAFQSITKAASIAGAGDSIYIGAGVYEENIVYDDAKTSVITKPTKDEKDAAKEKAKAEKDAAKAKSKASKDAKKGKNDKKKETPTDIDADLVNQTVGWTLFYGDQSGIVTGDKGEIVIRPRTETWTLQASNAANLLIYAITFQANPSHSAPSNGCYIKQGSDNAHFYYCKFKELDYAVRNEADNFLLSHGCQFQGAAHGIYSLRSDKTSVRSSKFDASTHGIVAYDAASTEVSDTQFSDTHPVTGETTTSRGIFATRTSLDVRNCEFNRNSSGVFGNDLTALMVDNCDFHDTQSHAVYCNGESLAMSNCRVRRGQNGVTLDDRFGKAAKLTDVVIEEMDVAVSTSQGDYDFDNVTLSENEYGLYQRSGCNRLTLKKSDTVKFSNNEYAVATNHTVDEDALLIIDGHDLSGNGAGIISYRTRVNLNNCVFAGERWGAYLSDSKSIDVAGCKFDGNETNPAGCTYGLYARSDDIRVSKTTTRNANYGLYIDNTSQNAPILKDVTSEDHTYAAIYLRNGAWTYTDADRNIFRNAPRGVMASNMTWKVIDVTSDASCQYPILDYDGDCTIIGANVKGKTTGLYAYRSKSLSVSKLIVSQCGSYGIFAYDCGELAIDNSSAVSNGSGIYVNDPDGDFTKITNVRCSDNAAYGILLVDTTLDPSVPANLILQDNVYGLSVHNRPLSLNQAMNITVTGNRYGVLSYRDKLSITGMQITDNATAVYAFASSIAISDSILSGTSYGLLGYPSGHCIINDSEFNDAAYGMRLEPIGGLDSPLEIIGTKIDNCASNGVYVQQAAGSGAALHISDSQITNSKNGVVVAGTSVVADRVTMNTLRGVGFHQTSGSSTLTNCRFQNVTSSWSILAYGDHCAVIATRIDNGRYGIGLEVESGKVVNSVINAVEYGIYLNRIDADYRVLQTTVANANTYGVYHNAGNTTIQNSIVDAGSYAIYDTLQSGTLTSDHNLVYSPNHLYENAQAGNGDINQQPIFLNASSGDLRLASGSPAINAGRDLSSLVTTDIAGNARPSFRAFDMGAFEYMHPSGSLRVLDWDEVAH